VKITASADGRGAATGRRRTVRGIRRPELTEVMDSLSRDHDEKLLEAIVPLAGQLPSRHADGIPMADIGWGTGHAANPLAGAYPRSTFVGYDLAADALEKACPEAVERGLTKTSFEVLDTTQLPADVPGLLHPGFW
jgi:methylase of polypeptide subunit release factors